MSAEPSFDAFYAGHGRLVRRVLMDSGVPSADLDDALQETFVIAHRLLPTFEGRSSIATWLHAIAWRVGANHRRRVRHAAEVGGQPLPDEEQEPLVSASHVHASFSDIDEENRDLLALHEIGGLSISLLSGMTGNARATVRQRLERGRATLTRALARQPPDEPSAWIDAIAARFEQSLEPWPEGVLRLLSCRLTCMSTFGNVVLAVWRGPASDEGLQTVVEMMVALAHARPEGIRYLNVVESTSSPPTREGRAMITWCAHALGSKISAAATVVEGSALMPLVAAVMNTSLFLARAPVNMRFFTSLPPALVWLDDYGTLEHAALTELIERMRQSLDVHPSKKT